MIKKKIVVTGGLGFIASNLIEKLLKQNYKVINVDKVSYSSNFYNIREISKNKDYKFFKCDISNKEKIYKLLIKEKPIALFNLAAESHVDRSIDDPYPFIKNNILGVFNLLESVKKYHKIHKKFKLIHISTDEVYGDIIKGRTSENHKYEPSSPYAASKASSDHLVYSYYKTYNLPVIITNCSNNFGPCQNKEKFIPTIITKLLNGEQIPLYGDGSNIRDWLYVENHVNTLIFLQNSALSMDNFCIGGSNELSNTELVKIIVKLLNDKLGLNINLEKAINFVQDRKGHDKRYAVNTNKIKKYLNFQNATEFQETLKYTISFYMK